jgi:O-antigen/teichoic acid export membrane protein
VRDVDLHGLGRTVKHAIAALASRTVVHQLVLLAGTVALTRLLGPLDFGVFAIVQSALAVLVVFGDTGVGGALVRQREEPTDRQLASVLYLQIALSAGMMAVTMTLAGWLPRIWPDLPASAPLLLRVMAVDFLLVSVRTPPLILMERRLAFTKLSVIDVAESTTFYIVAVALAASGFGAWALVTGVIAKGLLTTVLIYGLSSWRPRLTFASADLRPLIRFGVAQQLRHVAELVNAGVGPVVGGRMLGTAAVGYLTWALSTAYFATKVGDILARIGFPLFSRLQHDRALVGESLGRMIHVTAFAVFAWVGLCLGLGEQLTLVIFPPNGCRRTGPDDLCGRGADRLPVDARCAGDGRARQAGPLHQVRRRLDDPHVDRRPFATARWQLVGFAIGFATDIEVGNAAIAVVMHRLLPDTRFFQRVRGPLLACAAVAMLGRLVLASWATGLLSLGVSVLLLALVYVAVAWAIDGRALLRATSLVPQVDDRPGELAYTAVAS